MPRARRRKRPNRGFTLRGGTVHTISGATIEDGSVLLRNRSHRLQDHRRSGVTGIIEMPEDGKPQSLDTRQYELYKKYSGNPPK